MSAQEKAARIIATAQSECHYFEPELCGACYNHLVEGKWLAKRLADAALLAPDLPEPQQHGGELVWPLADPDGWAVTATDDYVRLSDERGAIITVNRKLARDLGHALTAAADYSEGKRD